MAPRKQNEVETTNPIDIASENEKLKQEIDQLKQMMQQFLDSQKQRVDEPKETQTNPILEEDEFTIIPPSKMTNLTSLYFGGMTLKGANDKQVRFEKFGMTRPVTFEDLTYICNNHRRLAEEGAFFIHNKDMVKALYLEDEYKKFINKETIENFITLPDEQITKMYKSTTKEIQETIVDIVFDGVKKNIQGENNKYNNRNKVSLISELCGKDIWSLANSEITQDK